MAHNAFGLSHIGQISVPVHDLDRAVTFYRDTLSMPHLFTVPSIAFFDCSGIRLMLSIPERSEFDHPSSIIYFKVNDIAAVHQTLSTRGVQFEDTPHIVAQMDSYDLWMAFFRDSEHNYLGIMSEVPHG
ncbi:MAG: VOC family protein [Herpetosiphonaceae bacterium]|nr:VOC family protein [Herpetosiphonaceae bacterium]